MIRRRDWLRSGLGMAGAAAIGGMASRPARADNPPPESDPAEAIKQLGPMMAKVKVEVSPLADRLHLITGPGGNMAALACDDGVLLVDCGFPGRTEEIGDAARRAGGKPVSVLINTHWHVDHAGGNADLARGGARIWATANTRKRLSTDQYNEAFRMASPASPPEALPSLTLEEADIYAGGEEIHLASVPPAHTDGDLIIHFRKADVIHAGDLFTSGGYPNIDANSRGWIGGMILAADRILKLAGPKTRIIPGHGPVSSPEGLAAFRRMLVGVHDAIAPLVDAGKTADEVVAASPTRPFDAAWGKGPFNGPMFARLAHGGVVKHREESAK